ncbi:MAG: hypothetical protein K1X53_07865 [Candidatus Sumerlaeaceae bacterium]|nr:hypothetical protein [Candidatus Sumerlaeaceae bacterium]
MPVEFLRITRKIFICPEFLGTISRELRVKPNPIMGFFGNLWGKKRDGGVRPRQDPEQIVFLEGPIERVNDKYVLRIPLEVGGNNLVDCTRSIASVEGELLVIRIPDWLAEKLGLYEGCRVEIDNADGRFNIRPAETE